MLPRQTTSTRKHAKNANAYRVTDTIAAVGVATSATIESGGVNGLRAFIAA
jgi:hypothetical protein